MAVIKVYSRINWLNKSESLTTPLGKTNLNKMDKAINLIDDEVVSMSAKVDEIDTTKVSADQLNNMVTDVSFNDKNGVISITKHNGTVLNIDTAMEKIAVNFEYNAQTQQLILTLENGEKQYIDMSALITQYEFKDTDTIAFSVDSDGKVSASIKSGSITKAMLSSEVMSAITLSENNAAASAQAAAQSATNADMDAKLAQSYSVGKSGIRDGEDTDNSKYYSEQAKKYADEAQEIAGGNFIPNSEKGVANGVAVLNANLAVEKAVADEDGNNIQNTYATQQQVPTLVKVDDKTITKDEDGTLHGAMSIEVDSELSATSTNPVQNKVITNTLQEKADKSETTVNLLKPTKETSIQDGVTFTNNNDGTYTMSGTATQNAFNSIELITLPKGKYKIVGAPSSYENNLYITKVNDFSYVKYSGEEFEVLDSSQEYSIVLRTYVGSSYTNVVFKPMITTNLSATYDDFVPYTGDTGSLNGDVAEIRKEYATKTDIPTSLPANGGNADTVNGHTVKSNVPENAVFTDTIYTLPTASGTQLGGVKTGSNIKNDDGVISISKENIVAALGYTPAQGTGAVSGVKGSAESSYRTGNVNITAENVRAANRISFDGATNSLKLYSGSTLLSNISLKTQTIATWENGTDAEIADMLTAHYKGQIKVSDYWSVGDTRKVSLSNGEWVELVIIGFDADTLTSSINGKTLAAVTWQQKNCLADKRAMSSNSNAYDWTNTNLRTWLRDTYYGYLPSKFKSLIKTVNKKSSHTLSTPSSTASPTVFDSQETIFIPSYGELHSNNIAPDKTTVYEFYKVASNVSKNMVYWTRTGWVYITTSNSAFGFYSSDGNSISANSYCGVAPAGCL